MADTREERIMKRSQDPRRNDDPADVGYRDDESRFADEGDPRPIDEMFR